MVIDKRQVKPAFCFTDCNFSLKFVSLSYDSIISSHVIATLSTLLAKPFLELHVKRIPNLNMFTYIIFLHWHQNLSLFYH